MNGAQIITTPSYGQSLLPGGWQIFKDTLTFYKEHWKIIGGIAILPLLFNIIQYIFFDLATSTIIFFILGVTAYLFASITRLAIFDAVAGDGAPIGGISGAYKKGISLLVPFTWISILVTLAILGGYALFIIPGVLLTTWLSVSIYPLLAERKYGIEALILSWFYVKGYWWSVLWRYIFFSIIVGAVLLTLGIVTGIFEFSKINSLQPFTPEKLASYKPSPIGTLLNIILNNLIVLPLGIIYSFLIYSHLRKIKPTAPAPEEKQKIKRNILIFVGIGIAAVVGIIVIGSFFAFTFLKDFQETLSGPATAILQFHPLSASLGVLQLLKF